MHGIWSIECVLYINSIILADGSERLVQIEFEIDSAIAMEIHSICVGRLIETQERKTSGKSVELEQVFYHSIFSSSSIALM